MNFIPPEQVVDANRLCSKCNGSANVKYCMGGRFNYGTNAGLCPCGEHMHRYCKSCHYEWLEKCLPTEFNSKLEMTMLEEAAKLAEKMKRKK